MLLYGGKRTPLIRHSKGQRPPAASWWSAGNGKGAGPPPGLPRRGQGAPHDDGDDLGGGAVVEDFGAVARDQAADVAVARQHRGGPLAQRRTAHIAEVADEPAVQGR